MGKNWKTYAQAALGAGIAGAVLVGWISWETAQPILAALGFGALAAMRAAFGKR